MISSEPQIEQDEYVETTAVSDRLEQLRELFPEAFRDGELDVNALSEAAGVAVDNRSERYSFTWAGKREARMALQMPPRASLVPADDESLNPDTTHNYFIEGDNLEVLKLLYKPYAGKVKMIYIDPPYNTGNDFVYPDNFAEPMLAYHQMIGQRDEAGKLTTSELDRTGHKHSTWLTMMYPRLFLARQLLTEDGVIFISIDDTEVYNLRLLMDEIFGEENFVANVIWQKSKKGDAKLIAQTHEYVLVVAKNKTKVIEGGKWRRAKEGADEVLAYYASLREQLRKNHDAISKAMQAWYKSLPKNDPRKAHEHYKYSDDRGLYFADNFAGPDDGRTSRPRYDIIHPVTGNPCKKPSTGWRWDEERTRAALAENPPRIHFGPDETTIPCRKSYLFEIDTEPFTSIFYKDGRTGTLELEQLIGPGLLDFPKDADVIKQFIQLTGDPNAMVMDFFAGSCTTAQAVLELNREDSGNRRFIMVQLPWPTNNADYPTIADIGKERIRRVIQRMQAQRAGQLPLSDHSTPEDLGFKVFKETDSAYKPWRKVNAANYAEQLNLYASQLADDWQPEELLWELAWREGYGLDATIEPQAGADKLYRISDPSKGQAMVVCLANPLPANLLTVQLLAGASLFVCLDHALDDTTAANLKIQCRAFGCRFRAI